MSDAADERSSGGSGATWAVSIMGVLVVYALSIGPVAKAVELIHGRNPPSSVTRPLEVVYAPLICVVDHFDPLERFYMWYFTLWKL